MLTGGVNAFREEIGKGKNFLSGKIESYPKVARQITKTQESVGLSSVMRIMVKGHQENMRRWSLVI